MKWLHLASIRAVAVAILAVAGMLALSAATATSARAEAMDTCPHLPTIQSLRDCVQHMTVEGVIDNQGIANSLLAKVDAAQAAVNRGQPGVAVNTLEAFVREARAQAGKHIAQPDADHLIMHAELVIQAVAGGGTA